MKILLIEDDEHIINFLQRGLKEDGYQVEIASLGDEGEYLALLNSYDLIILDWMLPNKSGIEILENLRKKEISTPIIMLTAKSDINNKVLGLRNGADDYLTKPFSYVELLARIEALDRRALNNGKNIIQVKNLSIDINKKTVFIDNISISLTAKEYELLIYLIKNKNSMVSKAMIEEQLWNEEEFINSNVVQVTIYHLRKKIGKDIIKSFRGLGYKIEI
jgi:DNA-binding response OmpR family regulator